jgi:hypothetical protein
MDEDAMTTSMVRDRVIGWRLPLWGAIAALLLLPLIAMQFTAEVAWTASDFAAAAVLLGGAGAGIELVMRHARKPRTKAALVVAMVALAGLIWLQGAVGIL